MSEEKKVRASFNKKQFIIEDVIIINGEEQKIKKDKDGNFIYKDRFGNVKMAEAGTEVDLLYQDKYSTSLSRTIKNGELVVDKLFDDNTIETIKEALSEENLEKIRKEQDFKNSDAIFNDTYEETIARKLENAKHHEGLILCENCGNIMKEEIEICPHCKNRNINNV
jgi:rubrerythrin